MEMTYYTLQNGGDRSVFGKVLRDASLPLCAKYIFLL